MEYAEGASNDRMTILIVEDHEALQDSLKTWLSSVLQDCIFLQVKSGEDALEQARICLPAIVLMDIMLPAMNGIEATRRIKNAVPSAQVIMLSIYEDAAYKNDAFTAGAAAYIPKRKMGTDLVPTITKLLSGVRMNH